MAIPNIFAHATSELSQDAFLCWLIAWADPEHKAADPALHEVARDFVRKLFQKAEVEAPADAGSVQLNRQVKGIDVLALIGADHAIVIEDKTNTVHHSDQLRRYQELVNQKYPNRKIAFIYLKTGDQSSYVEVDRQKWWPFTRKNLLEVLRGGEGKVSNAIFQDFLVYLEDIERAVQAFLKTPPSEWGSRAWTGFFLSLQRDLGTGTWGYVSNPSGGFMGFHWGWCPVDGGDVYLQIEELKLVVKLRVDLRPREHQQRRRPREPARRSELRDVWSRRVREGIQDPRFARPARLRSGNWMTVAVHEGEWISKKPDGCIDFDSTIVTLKRVTAALKALADATQGAAQDPQEGLRDATFACPAPEPECSR